MWAGVEGGGTLTTNTLEILSCADSTPPEISSRDRRFIDTTKLRIRDRVSASGGEWADAYPLRRIQV